jgi:pimeloyl-ACP methyl ester carboxylesterase
MADFDEFSLLHDNADEAGLPWSGPPAVARETVELPDGRIIAAIRWGDGPAEIVLFHGGAQNAHTWDTVALALGRPLIAIDMPGHGRSDWRPEKDYMPPELADDVALAVRHWAPDARLICGMSLGGMTSICLAAQHPELVRRLVVVDVTPGTDHAKAEPIINFVSGPEFFESFDAILERTVTHNPTRSVSSLRRGVLHNAREREDGSWVWRYDAMRKWRSEGGAPDFAPLWAKVDAVKAPLMLVRGSLSGVVGDEDVEEMLRRQPEMRVEVVEGAGHSVQGDRPLALAALIESFLD